MDASLKQRLIGAAVLVLLAVIFVPMLVKGPAPESGVSGVSLAIPPEPKSAEGVVTQDLPLTMPGAVPTGGVSGMPEAVVEPATPEPATAEDAPVPLVAVAAGDFAVSFGSYASTADADKVIAALKQAGLPGYREDVTLGNRQAQRVRIGPFADQATAESARLRAGDVRNDVSAKVITLDAIKTDAKPESKPTEKVDAKAGVTEKPAPTKPTEPAKPVAVAKPAEPTKPAVAKPEPAPSTPANAAGTGFVVQIGAFSSAADATAQRDALRAAGFNTFTDTVPSANGTLTRVRVGPVMTRAEADALKVKVQEKTGKDGMVRPHP